MRAIIIEEERFTEILALLKARCTDPGTFTEYDLNQLGISKAQGEMLLNSMFRTFNYEFVKWAQSHGASCTR